MGRAGSKYFKICSPPEYLSNSSLFWHTNNFAANKIVVSGCSKPELQTKDEKKSQTQLYESYI